MPPPHRTLIALATAALLSACGGGEDTPPVVTCSETGPYACQSGETEPLYTFQWALNYLDSFFATHADAGAYGGGIDLNVEPVHRQGIKGQGVKVLVIDTGVDLEHEDLAPNADYDMSWNFLTQTNDPSPLLTPAKAAHGTNVAGIIGAAQNGKGVMGLAPQVRIGGVPIVDTGADRDESEEIESVENFIDVYGGAPWSQQAHVMNASYGYETDAQGYSFKARPTLIGIRGLKSLRGNKGIVFVKAAGNSFDERHCGPLYGAYDCTNPGNDAETLEPNVIVTAALNAKGQASSYSSAGSVVWITGMAGEHGVGGRSGNGGRYGERSDLSEAEIASGRTGDGPTIFSTDIRSCAEGYSRAGLEVGSDFARGQSELIPGVKDNPDCDYSYLNGTSSAAPTISGVVALMLSANPELSWRDVRDILRQSARAIDRGYETRTRNDLKTARPLPYGALFDLRSNDFVAQAGDQSHIAAGATQVPVELGWTRNAAGELHSNWYGFGVPDAARAVELAQLYKKEPTRSKSAQQTIPPFAEVAELEGFDYQKVSLLGEFEGEDQVVDQFQVRIGAKGLCLGSIGLAVESPAGTKSLLKMPLDHFVHPDVSKSDFYDYGAGSYAFYGENAKGTWKIYALASNPRLDPEAWRQDSTCDAAPTDGLRADDAILQVDARVIAQ